METTSFYAYALRAFEETHTLAVRRLKDIDTASSALAEFLSILYGLDTEVKVVHLDRGFYDGKCLMLLQAHNQLRLHCSDHPAR